MKNLKKGDHVEIFMDDHSVGLHDKVECKVTGYVYDVRKDSVLLTYWLVLHDDPELVHNNIEPFVILKSTISKLFYIE